MKYYVNKETGQLLDEVQMRKQWHEIYIPWMDNKFKKWQDLYEEVVSVTSDE